MPRIARTPAQRDALVRARMIGGAAGGRHAAVAAEPPRPAPPTSLPGGRGASVVVASVWSTGRERLGADFVCDGVADEVQINAACQEVSDNGGGIVLLLGTYFAISDSIVLPSYVTLRGTGFIATVIDAQVEGTSILVTGIDVEISDLCVTSTVSSVDISTTSINANSGIAIDAGQRQTLVRNVFIESYVTGIRTVNHDNRVLNSYIRWCETGIRVGDSDNDRIFDNYLEDNEVGILCEATAVETMVSRNFVKDGETAFSFAGSKIEADANHLKAMQFHGVVLSGAECSFTNGKVYGGGSAGGAAYDAINVSGDRCLVTNNDIEPASGARTCIRIEATADQTRVALNRRQGGAVAILNDLGTNTRKNFDGSANDWNVAL